MSKTTQNDILQRQQASKILQLQSRHAALSTTASTKTGGLAYERSDRKG